MPPAHSTPYSATANRRGATVPRPPTQPAPLYPLVTCPRPLRHLLLRHPPWSRAAPGPPPANSRHTHPPRPPLRPRAPAARHTPWPHSRAAPARPRNPDSRPPPPQGRSDTNFQNRPPRAVAVAQALLAAPNTPASLPPPPRHSRPTCRPAHFRPHFVWQTAPTTQVRNGRGFDRRTRHPGGSVGAGLSSARGPSPPPALAAEISPPETPPVTCTASHPHTADVIR